MGLGETAGLGEELLARDAVHVAVVEGGVLEGVEGGEVAGCGELGCGEDYGSGIRERVWS